MTTNAPLETDERCPLCGEPLRDHPEACSKCDWTRGYRQDERARQEHHPRDAGAAALSIFPGAGHIFKGYKLAGWLLMLVGVPIVCVLAFAFTMFFGWLLVPAYWIAVGADAYLRKDIRRLGATPSADAGR